MEQPPPVTTICTCSRTGERSLRKAVRVPKTLDVRVATSIEAPDKVHCQFHVIGHQDDEVCNWTANVPSRAQMKEDRVRGAVVAHQASDTMHVEKKAGERYVNFKRVERGINFRTRTSTKKREGRRGRSSKVCSRCTRLQSLCASKAGHGGSVSHRLMTSGAHRRGGCYSALVSYGALVDLLQLFKELNCPCICLVVKHVARDDLHGQPFYDFLLERDFVHV